MSKENNTEEPINNEADLPEVEQELSKVATNPKQSLLILVGVIGVFAYLFFTLFFSSDDNKPSETPVPTDVVKAIQVSTDNSIPSIPTLPSPPKLEDPTPPPPPPPSPEIVPPTPIEDPALLPADSVKNLLPPLSPSLPVNANTAQGDDAKKRLDAKRKSAITLIAGKVPDKTPEQMEQEADFKYRGNMNLVLGRGKMLGAIIESAINSDFGGEIRAVINRDVYSEWGRNILIPKGSRIFGTYVTGINGAYGRIAIEWNRVDLATGYIININGTGMDDLGRKGQQGRVDNKFKERFGNAVLTSAFNITLASALDSFVKPVVNSQAAANQTGLATAALTSANSIFAQAGVAPTLKFSQICGTVPTAITDKTSSLFIAINTACSTIPIQLASATPDQQLAALMSAITTASNTSAQNSSISTQPTQEQLASQKAFTDISDIAKELLTKQKFDPTITIDQGTYIKIYVNKDYKFPKLAIKKVVK